MKYTAQHDWLAERDGTVTVGITDHAAKDLGDIVFVELPEQGRTFSCGEEIVVIESVKAASGIEAPFDGEVVEINAGIESNPELLNEDPEGGAWLLRVKPADPAALDAFMDEDAYRAMIGAEH